MAMATVTTTLSLLSPPLPKSPSPPLHALPPQHLLLSLPLRLPRRRRRGRNPIAARPNADATSTSPACDAREAERAVAELLGEHGASPADAAAVAARAPGYAAMLTDGVRELDELGLWASWSSGVGARGIEIGGLGFGRKVYFMGKSRRDCGVVPLLESLGVRLSSAKLIAPYVSAAGLPVLIDRVRDGPF